MVAKLQKRIALSRKLHIPKAISQTKPTNEDISINEALACIYDLKVEMEAFYRELMASKRQRSNPITNMPPKEVKVEKVGERSLLVKIRSSKGGNMLVPILEALEEMGLNVVQAQVSSKNVLFSMEALIAVPEEQDEDQAVDVDDVTRALVKALGSNQAGQSA